MADLAINMYKKANRLDDMIRLVKRHHPELLTKTHVHLGRELESDEKWMQAEAQYLASGEWRNAVNMYRRQSMWEDAFRVCRDKGSDAVTKQIAYEWARHLGGDSSVKLLTKHHLLDDVIDIACERAVRHNDEDNAVSIAEDAFAFAFELARAASKAKIPYVHEQRAIWFEDLQQFDKAEEEFIAASKPREAVLMHVHAQAWDNAARVAEQHDPPSMKHVLEAQGRHAFTAKDYARAEALLLRAEAAGTAIQLYLDAQMWDDAIRLAREYVPQRVRECEALKARHGGQPSGTGGTAGGGAASKAVALREAARQHEVARLFDAAITTYLELTVDVSSDVDMLVHCWGKAVELATKFVPARASATVNTVCQRLAQVQRFDEAADQYLVVGTWRCHGCMLWDAMRACSYMSACTRSRCCCGSAQRWAQRMQLW